MRQFIQFVVSFNVYPQIQPEVIRYSKLVTVAVQHLFLTRENISANGIGYGPARLVGKISRKTESFCELIICYQREIVWLIIICRKKLAAVDPFLHNVAVQFYE